MMLELIETQACLPTAGFTSICPWAEVKDNTATLDMICGLHMSFPAFVDFLNQDYCYKLVATQILPNTGLPPIPYTGQKFLLFWGLNQHCIP
jgi:hypothetical protein